MTLSRKAVPAAGETALTLRGCVPASEPGRPEGTRDKSDGVSRPVRRSEIRTASGLAGEAESGGIRLTERDHEARTRRRLEEEGWELESTALDKHWWRQKGTGRRATETHMAFELAEKEGRRLREEGWEPTEGEPGGSYWRNPESGRLYPRDAAYDLVFGGEPKETE